MPEGDQPTQAQEPEAGAEAHAADDKKRREVVDAKNQGESLAHDAEKALKEYGDKVSQSDKSAIEAAIAAVRTALQGEDVEAIKARNPAAASKAMLEHVTFAEKELRKHLL